MVHAAHVAMVIAAAVATAAGGSPPATIPTTAPTTQPATAPAAGIEPLRLWTSPADHIRLQCPATWKVLAHPPPGQVFAARIPLRNASAPFAVIDLRIDRATPGPLVPGPERDSVDSAATAEIADAMAAYVFNNGGKKVAIHPDTLGNPGLRSGAIPARRVRFLTDLPAGPLATIHVVAVRNGIAYVWTLAAPAPALDALLPEVNRTFASFETLQ
jgi:hypothetical protein